MRKAFNFYRSYYEVAKELNEKDRALFLWAVLQRQFEGLEPNLTGLPNFAYISQKHSIDSQILGYESKTKEKLIPTEGGTQGGKQGGVKGGSVQEKEKEKEKEKEETKNHKQPIPSVDEFVGYGLSLVSNASIEALQLKYESWVVNGWCTNKDGKSKKIVNWKSTLANTISYLPKQSNAVKPDKLVEHVMKQIAIYDSKQ